MDQAGRRYRRYRFAHKFKRRYVAAEVVVPPDEPWLTTEQVELFRNDALQFDVVPPEVA